MSSISSLGSGVNFVGGGGLSFEVVDVDVDVDVDMETEELEDCGERSRVLRADLRSCDFEERVRAVLSAWERGG